jgi:hypothetical protein
MPKKVYPSGFVHYYGKLTFAEQREFDSLLGNQPEAPLAIPSRAYLAACRDPGGISLRIEAEAGSSQTQPAGLQHRT